MNARSAFVLVSVSVVIVSLGAGTVALSSVLAPCRRLTFPQLEVENVNAPDFFSSSYVDARLKFLDAARAAGGDLMSFENTHTGPDNERLFTDVARFGPRDSKTILVLSSGTHGVEGFAGSGVQTGLLRDGIVSRVDPRMSIVMIHAINPYGMAHLRRANEDNIDLNRNFIDHSKPYPENLNYDRLADVVAPKSLSFAAEVGSWFRFGWFFAQYGKAGITQAVSGAQYSHPDGLFYGGTFPTWSNSTVRAIADAYLSGADRVVIVDVHTGLGDYGDAEIILNSPENTPGFQRAVVIWGQERVKSTVSGESESVHLGASLKLAWSAMLPNTEVTAVSLEYGTVPIFEVYKALRVENWLHHHGGIDHPKAREINECLLRAFHPRADDWQQKVWIQGKEVVGQALDYLMGHEGR